MNNKKVRRNFFIIGKEKYYKSNINNIKKIVEIINKDRLVIVSGLRNIGKVNFIKNLLNKTGITNNYFYFNKSNDPENMINSYKELDILLNDYVRLYKKPNIIILQNVEKINGIKEFLTKIYKENHKIVLVGNNIKIGGIKEIEILNDYNLNNENLLNVVKFGSFNELKQLGKLKHKESNTLKQLDLSQLKESLLNFLTSDIFLSDIFKNFGVKSIELYNSTITYLAENNIFVSQRELQKNLNNINKISLKTVIDYIDFSIQSKIIKRVYRFDIKTNKPITSKGKYYFTDNGIRNSLVGFNANTNILLENLIFNILEYNNYTIYSGLNGKFDFSFYIEKENEKMYIHISKQETKEELKKEVNKLLKIGKEGKKYLLVQSIEKLGIKKLKYDSVEIIEINDFLIKFGKQKN
ncbi:MAG: AAA family ATPase [Candidatus Gracilibacteria bacterium]